MSLEETAAPSAEASEPAASGFASRVAGLANAVLALHHQERRGDLAALRRMDPRRPYEEAFVRILVKLAPKADLDEARRLALLVKILALPTGRGALEGGRRKLGRAMAQAGVSERRVQVLMTACGAALDDLLVRLARRLTRASRLPYEEIGRMVLGNEAAIEETRFAIARGYWAASPDDDTDLSSTDVPGDD